MKEISKDKYSQVFYDEKKDIYIKNFTPKLKKRIKFFLGLRKYPGKNYKYISDLFNKMGIKTPEIVEYGKYHIITKNISGKILEKVLEEEKDKIKIEKYLKKYIEIVSIILKNKIYYEDFHFGNFILFNDDLYILDLEDYKKDILFIFRKKKIFKILKRKLMIIVYDKLREKGIDAIKIYKEIKKNVYLGENNGKD